MEMSSMFDNRLKKDLSNKYDYYYVKSKINDKKYIVNDMEKKRYGII